jgi:PAS domain S-box-containing protein
MTPTQPEHDLQANAIWNALAQNPAVGFSVVDVNGVVKFANQKSAEMFLGDSPESVVGKSLYDLFPKAWADERMAILAQIARTGRPVIIRHIRRGVQIQSNISLMECPEGNQPFYLIFTHEGEHDPHDQEHQVIESKLADLGPLDVLTRRELEVLALIKHGMTLDEIAKLLHRSRKTIDNHRTSIAKKLGESSRVRLAQLAEQAGLELKDADLRRIPTRREDE